MEPTDGAMAHGTLDFTHQVKGMRWLIISNEIN